MQQQMEIAAHWGVYTYNKELRDLVAVGAACGVTTAFKAPVRGARVGRRCDGSSDACVVGFGGDRPSSWH
jgi:hypothetical protein